MVARRETVLNATELYTQEGFKRVLFDHYVGVTVNNRGEMKGSAIIGPVALVCAEFWSRIVSNAGSIAQYSSVFV